LDVWRDGLQAAGTPPAVVPGAGPEDRVRRPRLPDVPERPSPRGGRAPPPTRRGSRCGARRERGLAHLMAAFVGRRLVEAIPVLILSSILVFSILHLIPGDPIDAMLGAAAAGISTPEAQAKLVAQVREQLGLNDPLPIQYLHWLGGALRLDFGESFIRHQSVAALIAQRLPATLELAGAALLLSVTLGIGLGILAALKHHTFVDAAVMLLSLGRF